LLHKLFRLRSEFFSAMNFLGSIAFVLIWSSGTVYPVMRNKTGTTMRPYGKEGGTESDRVFELDTKQPYPVTTENLGFIF